MKAVTRTYQHSFNYTSYLTYMDELIKNKSCSGEITNEHIESTKVNAFRIKRIYNQIEIIPELSDLLSTVKENWEWLVLMETWCGDGGQNLPIIARLAELAANIKLTIILRDEHPEIMNAHLTNGTRSIPKLVCIDLAHNKTLGTWGPRPESIQQKTKEIRKLFPDIPHSEFAAHLHRIYSNDHGQSIQKEFVKLIKQWNQLSQIKQ